MVGTVPGVGPREVAATSVILSHESVSSGVRASFVRRRPFKPFNRCAPFKPSSRPVPCAYKVQIPSTLRLLNRFWIFDPSALLRTGFGFWIPTESWPPFFRSSSSQQNSDCRLQLLATTVRLAPPTHPGERFLPIMAMSLLKVR